MLLFLFEQGVRNLSLLNAYEPLAYSQNARGQKNVYYVPSQHAEVSPWFFFDGKLDRLAKAFSPLPTRRGAAMVSVNDCARIPLRNASVDYIFTDPPFGANIFYADLNFLLESWHRVFTAPEVEAIMDKPKNKGLYDYQELMRACFEEYCRVLKPGRWITIVFSNSSNAVWRAIQEAMGTAGFVVADVRTLDKKQGSYRQVTSSAVKQDLVISAYKPTRKLTERFDLKQTAMSSCWEFVTEHLRNVPVFSGSSGEAEVIAERTAQMLHDRMTAFHVQHGVGVPVSGADFFSGLEGKYPQRDGMYFLPEQVGAYERKRVTVSELKQLSLFVMDEASAIQWVRQQLQSKPQTLQDLTPQFNKAVQEDAWVKHERGIELRQVLDENFLSFSGEGVVPSQIHSYLSTNFKECRKLTKTDPLLVEKAIGRWFVPDPAKQGDLDQVRAKKLLAEFSEYRSSKEKKIKEFRTEAIRVGFKAAYDAQEYESIISVAGRIPESVLQEDAKLLMYFDVALMRVGGSD